MTRLFAAILAAFFMSAIPANAAKVGDIGGFNWICLSKSVLIDIANAGSDEKSTERLRDMMKRGICGAFEGPYPFKLLELITTVKTENRTAEIWRITNGDQQAFGVVFVVEKTSA